MKRIFFAFKIKNYDSLTPLEIACKNGYDEIGLILLEKTDIDTLENSIYLICSFREEKLNFVEQIFDKLKNSSEQKIPTIFKNLDIFETLILNNHLNIIEFVLKEFGSYLIDRVDNNGNQLVHLAAKNGSTDLLNICIMHNAVSLKTNLNNDNALHIAAINNRFNLIKDFLIYDHNFRKNSNTFISEDESLINENKEELNDQRFFGMFRDLLIKLKWKF